MNSSLQRLVAVSLVTVVGLLATPASHAAALDLPLIAPKPSMRVIAPVAAPISADPTNGAVRGTVIMVHAGGWAGHDAHAQDLLYKNPGSLFLKRGWRVVSIDYEEGVAGLQDVLNTAGEELTRRSGKGPLCIYGESSGGHLALVAASRLRAIDCVVTLGAPTDINLYEAEGSLSADPRVRLVAFQASRLLGTTTEQIAPWDPVTLAPRIRADVLLMRESDDPIVPATHVARFQQARPTTQVASLEAGEPADPSTTFVHGTISDAGRARYASALGSFADRAVAARRAELRAARSGCKRVNRSLGELGLSKLTSALRCLSRKDARVRRAGTRTWQRTSFNVRGEVNAARIWTHLRATGSGRRALLAVTRRRAGITVRASDRSKIILRARR